VLSSGDSYQQVSQTDPTRSTLVDLDGVIMDLGNGYWVKFVVREIPTTAPVPHGLTYELTLHERRSGKRVLGYDNAHPVTTGRGPGAARTAVHDHRHTLTRTFPYTYVDAGTLLEDFWRDVKAFLKAQGVE
jgi:hypothetical protein